MCLMLQVLPHSKFYTQKNVADFYPSESTKTSFILGVLQYLLDEVFRDLLSKACQDRCFPSLSVVGKICDSHFF